MGHKRNQSEENFAKEELEPALKRVSKPEEMAKFLSFAAARIEADPTKLAARMAHYLSRSRTPTTGIAFLLKEFEKLP